MKLVTLAHSDIRPHAQESPHFPLPGYRSRACSGLQRGGI